MQVKRFIAGLAKRCRFTEKMQVVRELIAMRHGFTAEFIARQDDRPVEQILKDLQELKRMGLVKEIRGRYLPT